MSTKNQPISVRTKVAMMSAFIVVLSLVLPSSNFLNRLTVRKVFADTTPQSLPFSQNWTNTGLITVTNDWSGVPGIIGYRGDALTGATGVDPQTVVADGSGTPVNVLANQTNPNTNTTGGIAEFDTLANPVVAFQGSGTARAPHLVISLNTTGQTGINVSYNLRDVDGSTDNSVQPVALQYRVGASGNYTNLPAGFVADASSGPSLATLVTPVSVTLPVACENQPVVQVRVITTDAVGSDEWIGVDDISVTAGGGGGTPTLNINDVAQAETNSGTTNFNFTVSLTAPAGAGGVTFTVNTANGTATLADNDYVQITNGSGSISMGNTSTTVTVQVNGDTTTEPNETFFVNISNVVGATAGDNQGQGTINNDDVTLTPIHTIQGSGSTSPLVSTTVTTSGIVTGIKL
ncbi:MAG: Calx-beta domain-containing protein, partial [Pyrinomonadaceae bacterium]